MNNPIKTGIVGLNNLPQDLILIGIKNPLKEELLKHLKSRNTRKSLNIKLSQFYNLKDNEKVTLNFLLKTTKYLAKQGHKQFSYKNLEKNIEIIGTKRGDIYIRNPKLPFNFKKEEGAYFIAAILFDGGIDRQYKPHYGNINLGMRLRIVKCAESIFGEITSKEVNAEKRLFVRFPKTMGIILNHCFNIGVGNKMYCNNRIPDFIFSLDKQSKSYFLRQAFDDDGTVVEKTIGLIGVTDVKKDDFDQNKKINFNLLEGIKELLKDFDIDSNPLRFTKTYSNQEYRKKGEFRRYIFRFSITGRKNLDKFYRNIGFNLEYKMKKLDSTLKSYKVHQLRKGEISKIALEACKKERDNIAIPHLAKIINRSYRQTVMIMRGLEKKGFLKLKRPSINVKGRRLPAIYTLTS